MLYSWTTDGDGAVHGDTTLPPWIDDDLADRGLLAVRGAEAGGRETFVTAVDGAALVGTSATELLAYLDERGHSSGIDPFAISQLLTYGLSPLPHTVFDDVKVLGTGMAATISMADGGVDTSITVDEPFLLHKSRQDETADAGRLRELIAQAMARQMAASPEGGIIMLSSGKDSVALAVALADIGADNITAVTFKSRPWDVEYQYAENLSTRFGFKHEWFEMPGPAETERELVSFFENAAFPSVDYTTPAYAVAGSRYGFPGAAIIDGTGNDSYMGFVRSRETRIKQRMHIRNNRLAVGIGNRVGHDSRINYITRPKAAITAVGRLFRDKETMQFYADATDTRSYWEDSTRSADDLDGIDFIRQTEHRHRDFGRVMSKVRRVAEANDLNPVFPYADPDLADYYFNLPDDEKFDLTTHTNKLLLRKLLAEAVDYDPEDVGSNHFGFNGEQFILDNEAFVRREILECDLWLPEIEPLFNGWMRELPKRHFLFQSLLTLFLISGWHNHSRYVQR